MAEKASQRGILGTILDRLVGRGSGLPPERNNYSVLPVKIPLEGGDDNIELHGDVYQPIPTKKNEAPLGTILVQCPYGRRLPISLLMARFWAARGYIVLFVSTRGSYGSSGEVDPARNDVLDAPRVVRWMRRQPWYTGSFATFGMSYLGFAQYALFDSGEPLEDLEAAIILAAPDDFADMIWGTGSIWLPLVDWAEMTTTQESKSILGSIWSMVSSKADGNVPVKATVPLLDGMRGQLGDKGGWAYRLVENPDLDKDETGLWAPMKHTAALDKIKVPVLLAGGWQDIFGARTIGQYQRLRDNGCTVGLTMGPWTHMEVGGGDGVLRESLEWLDRYLGKKTKGDIRPTPVRVNVTGVDEWRWLPQWPPAGTKPASFYLDSDGRLVRDTPPSKTDQSQFTFDPHHPTRVPGGPLLNYGGYTDDTALAGFPDVLSFTTTPLDRDIEVMGKPRVEILHSSDNPHVDVFFRLCEVNSKGVSRNISEEYRRLDPARVPTGQIYKIELDLTDIAHHFKKGTSIRLLVAGACFPHYAYNLGSGEPQATGTTLRPAQHTVHTGGLEGSKVLLPIALK